MQVMRFADSQTSQECLEDDGQAGGFTPARRRVARRELSRYS